MTTKPDYTAIEGKVNQVRSLLDVAEDVYHEPGDNADKLYAVLMAVIRVVDELHVTCCQFEYKRTA